jgi:hypothetical protein
MTTQTYTHTGYGIEYANGDREWYDDAMLRDEAYALVQDEGLAFAYPEDVALPVAKLRREVTTTLTITREVA